MKEKIIILLFCLFIASFLAVCDNGEPPEITEDNAIEEQFIVDYGALGATEDFFDAAAEAGISKLGGAAN